MGIRSGARGITFRFSSRLEGTISRRIERALGAEGIPELVTDCAASGQQHQLHRLQGSRRVEGDRRDGEGGEQDGARVYKLALHALPQ